MENEQLSGGNTKHRKEPHRTTKDHTGLQRTSRKTAKDLTGPHKIRPVDGLKGPQMTVILIVSAFFCNLYCKVLESSACYTYQLFFASMFEKTGYQSYHTQKHSKANSDVKQMHKQKSVWYSVLMSVANSTDANGKCPINLLTYLLSTVCLSSALYLFHYPLRSCAVLGGPLRSFWRSFAVLCGV